MPLRPGWSVVLWAITAHAIRAILLASATATNLKGFFCQKRSGPFTNRRIGFASGGGIGRVENKQDKDWNNTSQNTVDRTIVKQVCSR
jgi:hypothetical protein